MKRRSFLHAKILMLTISLSFSKQGLTQKAKEPPPTEQETQVIIKKVTEVLYPIHDGVRDTSKKVIGAVIVFDSCGKIVSDIYRAMENHSGFIRQVRIYYNDESEVTEYCFYENDTKGKCWKPWLGEIPDCYGDVGLIGPDEQPTISQRLNPATIYGKKYNGLYFKYEYNEYGSIAAIFTYDKRIKRKPVAETVYLYEYY